MNLPFHDRTSAGRDLAQRLLKYRKQPNVVVLALPRGGVPVAVEVARELHAELDIIVVRKLGTPGREELAMGAIGSGGVRVLNEDVVSSLGIGKSTIDAVAAREQIELERRMTAYRGERPWPDIDGKRVILVDDGVATGATMRAAIAAVDAHGAAKIIVAVPVAPIRALAELHSAADEVVCLATPEPFRAVGLWYATFPQLADEEVSRELSEYWTVYDTAEAKQGRMERRGRNFGERGRRLADVRQLQNTAQTDARRDELAAIPARLNETSIE